MISNNSTVIIFWWIEVYPEKNGRYTSHHAQCAWCSVPSIFGVYYLHPPNNYYSYSLNQLFWRDNLTHIRPNKRQRLGIGSDISDYCKTPFIREDFIFA